jgi:hypothetical protein
MVGKPLRTESLLLIGAAIGTLRSRVLLTVVLAILGILKGPDCPLLEICGQAVLYPEAILPGDLPGCDLTPSSQIPDPRPQKLSQNRGSLQPQTHFRRAGSDGARRRLPKLPILRPHQFLGLRKGWTKGAQSHLAALAVTQHGLGVIYTF